MQAIIIIIGSEVLSGETLDTNSMVIGQTLNEAGIPVIKKITITDEKEIIIQALDEALFSAELVIMTGGLGPTNDDITKTTLTEYLENELVFSPDVFENIKEILKHRYPRLTMLNEEQAMIPKGAKIFNNRLGTAPGLLIEKNKKFIIAMPGIPYETETMMKEQVLPWLQNNLSKTGITLINKNIRTIGAPESVLASSIKDIEDNLPADIKLAYLPHLGQVKLRLTAYGNNKEFIESKLKPYVDSISERLGDYVYGYDDEELPACIGRLLKERNASLAIAESCTGGYIAHLITTVPGSSVYFKGGLVAYSNEIKISELGISDKVLHRHGAVSKETAESMAKGIMNRFNTDYSLATTGIAGPDGGTDQKPVGTLWISAASKDKVISKRIVFNRGRIQNIEYFSVTALNLLRKLILDQE